jgi:hypothetical protein
MPLEHLLSQAQLQWSCQLILFWQGGQPAERPRMPLFNLCLPAQQSRPVQRSIVQCATSRHVFAEIQSLSINKDNYVNNHEDNDDDDNKDNGNDNG